MGTIPFLLDERMHRIGNERWVGIEYDKSPHVLWAGRTSSGKTVAAKILLARTILLAPPELQPVELTVIDPKADTDFSFLDGLPRLYRGEAAPRGLSEAFEAFRCRQRGEDASRNLKIIFIDEFASLVNLMETKAERETAQRSLALLLMLSRSYRCSIQLATQQPSAQTFGLSGSGSREQLGAVCLLGDSGAETQQMLFDGDSREKIREFGSIGGRGVGWLTLNGGIAQPVRVPYVGSMEKLNAVLHENLAYGGV